MLFRSGGISSIVNADYNHSTENHFNKELVLGLNGALKKLITMFYYNVTISTQETDSFQYGQYKRNPNSS